MRKKLTITAHRKKRHWVSHRKGKPHHVWAKKEVWSYQKRDIGTVGRGRRVILALRKGRMEGYHLHESEATRRRILDRLARKYGEKTVLGMLQALYVFAKNPNNPNHGYREEIAGDRRYVAGAFIGRRKVKFGLGFKRKRR